MKSPNIIKQEFYFSSTKRKWLKAIPPLILFTPLVLYFYTNSLQVNIDKFYMKNFSSIREIDKNSSRNISQSIICKIPKLDPFDPSIKKFINSTTIISKLKCNTTRFPLLFTPEFGNISTIIKVNRKSSFTNCCYKLVTRKESKDNPDNSETISKKCYPLKKKTQIPWNHEFLAIYCDSSSFNKTLQDAIALTPFKKDVEKRIKKLKKKPKVNLIILGIDSMSHMNLKRSMPNLIKYMVKEKGGIGMQGYSRIADNTYPNLIAVFSSLNEEEANKTCLKQKFFDDCSFLWNYASSLGYRTSYGEDNPIHGIFNYLKKGFSKQPTDYYLRPLARVTHKKIENGVEDVCYGSQFKLDFLLKYMKAMYSTMNGRRYFQFLWSTGLTHDCMNCGAAGEPKILEFFKWLDHQGGFNNSVVVLMSDHGTRYGKIRKTRQGKIEENMPLIYFMFPPWFKNDYGDALKNLKVNADKLTSHYDTYETFKDILNLDGGMLQNTQIEKRDAELKQKWSKNHPPRGISLFLQIPQNRSCSDAQIEEQYCTCHSTQAIPIDSFDSKQAAIFSVFKMNKDLHNYPNCSLLTLSSIQDSLSVNLDTFSGGNVSRAYQVAFTTSPGEASFGSTVVIEGANNTFRISGEISRTNAYKNQSYCVDVHKMKKYCYCRSLL